MRTAANNGVSEQSCIRGVQVHGGWRSVWHGGRSLGSRPTTEDEHAGAVIGRVYLSNYSINLSDKRQHYQESAGFNNLLQNRGD
jgi:hypothetical protein